MRMRGHVLALLAAAAAFPAYAQVNSYSADAYAKPVYEGYTPPKNAFGQDRKSVV